MGYASVVLCYNAVKRGVTPPGLLDRYARRLARRAVSFKGTRGP